MLEAVIAIILFAMLAITAGLVSFLFARRIVMIERWIITLPLRIFKRGWPLVAPSRREIICEKIIGIILIALGIYLLFQFPVQWGKLTPAATRNSGEMDALIARYAEPLIDRGEAIGVAVGVIEGGKSYTAGFGQVKIADSSQTPDANTIFEIGSVTKVFTACALSAMVQRGQVRLDEPVGSLLPRSFKLPSYRKRQITLVDLATHTSGLPRVADNSTGFRDIADLSFIENPYASYSEKELREFLAGCTLASQPGKHCEYSNVGMGLLGYALSLRQHRSYSEMIEAEVCHPLGLKDTSVNPSEDQVRRLAQGYYGVIADGTDIIAFPANPWEFNDTNAGAGALRSTVNDLMKFVRANLGSAPAGLRSTLEATHKVRYRIDNRMDVCLAWHTLRTKKHKEPIIWHNGGTGGYSSFIGFCKEHHTGVVLLSNVSPSGESTDAAALKILYSACKRSGQ